MSLRQLPELHVPATNSRAACELPERAVQSFDSRIRAAAGDATITIFDVIGEDYFGDGVSPNRIGAALRSIGNQPVTVQINSPGGLFDDGLAIYNMLRMHPAEVTVQVIGMAASAASIIAMAGDKIEIARAGHMMVHNTQWMAIGDRHAMQFAHDAMAKFDDTLAALYVDRTGADRETVEAMMDAETFLTGPGAVEAGFADDLLSIDLTRDEAASNRGPLYKVEAALASGRKLPRAERRRLLNEIAASKPGAADDNAMPGAGDLGLGLALAKLKLIGA
jgi:ATP-dependent Clp protease, protease subunit